MFHGETDPEHAVLSSCKKYLFNENQILSLNTCHVVIEAGTVSVKC